MTQKNDHTAAMATAFFIGNLLFVGIFYLALWGLYLLRYADTTQVSQNHLKQALVASTITTVIFLALNMVIILTTGYASVGALIGLETYYMLVVPPFMLLGIMAFIRASKGEDYQYPLISRIAKTNP